MVLIGNIGITASAADTSLSRSYRNAYKKILKQTDCFQGVYIGDLTGDSREVVCKYKFEYMIFL